MRMEIFYYLLLLVALSGRLMSAENEDVKIDFSGFVRTDAILDSRSSATLRESAIMLYPLPANIDQNDKDINDNSALTMFVLHTRLRAKMSGPEAFGAKTSAMIEGEFFGATDSDANGFRLRHAFINLSWTNSKLLFGQYWNPMFITEVLPNYNFASPFLAYGRRPQLKYMYSFGDLSLAGAASMQSDFKSIGPDGEGGMSRSTSFIKNSSVPSLNINAMYKSKSFIIGALADYKKLRPLLSNAEGTTDETIGSATASAYFKISTKPVVFKFQGIYGANLSDVVMLGGYAPKLADSTEYANTDIMSCWSEISTNFSAFSESDITLSLLGAYTQNLGAEEEVLTNKIYAMGTNIDNVIRLAPSIIIKSGALKLIAEYEYTRAEYGDFLNNKLELGNLKSYANSRISLAAVYLF